MHTVDGSQKLSTRNILVATGSRPMSVPGFEFDEEQVLSSNGILAPHRHSVDPDLVPSAIYCEPQVSGFGLREDQALEQCRAVKKSVFNYHGAGKTIAVGKPVGLVKVLCDPETDELLGAHIVGHNATELLLARSAELLPEDIAGMIHAHPTISEAIMEAMRGVNGQPIHG
jgi:dihydrolipoamide dehydrogenase